MALPRKDHRPEYGKTRAALFVALLVGASALALLAPTAAAASPYRPPELTNQAVQDATLQVALEYANAVPGLDARTLRWYLYAVEHRESTFNVNWCNYNDGAGSWNAPVASFWPTRDHLPHGCGLTQPTGWTHEGMPYPGNKATPPTTIGKGIYGSIAPPRPVTALTNPFDPLQNLRRFVTEEVLPDYVLIKQRYPSFTPEQTLRAVAFHWNKGEYQTYNPANCDYLCLYDKYVAVYKPAVLADTAWPGGATSSAPAPATGSGTTTFNVGSGANAWWIEVYVGSSAGSVASVSASVNGGAAIPLAHASWGAWTTSTSVPAGSSVVFTATVNGVAVKSPVYTWLSTAAPATSTASATFQVSPNVNNWWIEVKVAPSASAVSATVNGGAPVALKPTSWGTWATSSYVPSGARVVFTATVNGASATSTPTTWP